LSIALRAALTVFVQSAGAHPSRRCAPQGEGFVGRINTASR
jgi:hypothetical protein